jgi:hypothetical protein
MQVHTAAVQALRAPSEIRTRCHQIYEFVESGYSAYFQLCPEHMPAVVAYVQREMIRNYPQGEIPYHSRWRHFECGTEDRVSSVREAVSKMSPAAQRMQLCELAVISVLLDAGAGAQWRYVNPTSLEILTRSEGLAIASLHAVQAGLFSSEQEPGVVDALGLQTLSLETLARGFQVTAQNPLVGLQNRLTLLQRLGNVVANYKGNRDSTRRLGEVVTHFFTGGVCVSAQQIFSHWLEVFSPIWPSGYFLGDLNLGDVGEHPCVSGIAGTEELVAFHKLSQWLTYSLVEPFEWTGVQVEGIEVLTGLPEYRNGGLFLDFGVIKPKKTDFWHKVHIPTTTCIVEWRALTVGLLDEVAEAVRQARGLTAQAFPLAKLLQGGTWSAGRRIAQEKRKTSEPPLKIQIEGTLF